MRVGYQIRRCLIWFYLLNHETLMNVGPLVFLIYRHIEGLSASSPAQLILISQFCVDALRLPSEAVVRWNGQ